MWQPNNDECNCQQGQGMKISHEESLRGVDIKDISAKQAVTSFFTFLVFGFSVWWLLFGQESFQKKKQRRKKQKQQQRTKRKRVCKSTRKQQQQQDEKKRTKNSSRSSVPKALIFKTDNDDESINTFSDDESIGAFSGNTFSEDDDESRNNLSDEDGEAEEEECKLVMTDCSCDDSDDHTTVHFDISDHTTLSSIMSSRSNESTLNMHELGHNVSLSKSSSGTLEKSSQVTSITSASSESAESNSSGTLNNENNEKIKQRSNSSCERTDQVNCEMKNILKTVVFSIQGNLNGDCAAMLCNVLEYQIDSIQRVSINLVTATATIRYYEQNKINDFDRIHKVLERFNVKGSISPESSLAISINTEVGPIQRPTRRSSMIETRSRVDNNIQRPERISKFERHMSI